MRRLPLLLAAVVFVAATGCREAAPRELRADEARLVAWWFEDVARGRPRNAGELQTEGGSAALARVASWAGRGSAAGDLPQQLAARRARWPAVRGLCRAGVLVVVEPGLLALHPDAPETQRELAQRIADAENADRRTLETLTLTIAQPDAAVTRRFRAELRDARVQLDGEAGARRWP